MMSTRFKRSSKVALMVMVPATTIMLASCSSEEPVQTAVYETADQCASYYNPEQCQAEFAAAKALHPQVAPKYTDKAACENDFGAGNCEAPAATTASTTPAATSSSGFFMPMMMGFMAGQLFSGGGRSNLQAQPLYKSRDDNSTFRTANNQPVSRFTGPVKVMPSRMAPQAGKVVNRGGFGAQAQKRSEQQSSGG